MAEKTFALRVDVESDRGIREGLPKLLDLLKKHNIKASFYLVMGGESNILEILKYRRNMTSSAERSMKIWTLKDKIRMALFPRDFAAANKEILGRILNEGHELGVHGWKHREWTRGLNQIDINNEITKAVSKYEKLFGKKPISWASPGFNTNENVINILNESGFKFTSDFEGENLKNYGRLKNVPITICGENKTPIIEWMISQGKTDDEILQHIKRESNNHKIISFYIHDLFEARFKLDLLEKIFEFFKNAEIKNKRIIDY
ncbi:MAG TPA: polysaccharide deacetylase family protein [Candidatus Omnitrophota bacterium]|nr:polysaccharide deacetylase family protein [Candidatus Omnitrophota bacterium]